MATQPFSLHDDSYENMTYEEKRALQKRRGQEHLYDSRYDRYKKSHSHQNGNGTSNGNGFELREDAHN